MPRHTLFSSFNLSLPLHTTVNSSTGVSLLVRCFHYFFYNLDFIQIQTSLSCLPSSWQRKIMHCLHINPLLICTWFLKSLVHEIDFWTWLLKWIFMACVACKNPVRNRPVRWTWFFKLDFSKIKCRRTGDMPALQIPMYRVFLIVVSTDEWENYPTA